MLTLDTPEFYERLTPITPTKCVPALVHGDTKVWDSLAIIDYCARLAPEKFWWPKDMDAYGHARSIVAEMHSGFTALRTHAPMNIHGTFNAPKPGEAVQKNIDRIEALFIHARTHYAVHGDFLFGDFSAADMMYMPVVSRFKTYGIVLDGAAGDYCQAALSHPLYAGMVNRRRRGRPYCAN